MKFLFSILLFLYFGYVRADINFTPKYSLYNNNGDSVLFSENAMLIDDDFSILTPRKRPVGLTLILFGPTIITSLQLDYFVTEEFQIDFGAGLFGLFLGGKYHFILNKSPSGTKVKDDYFQDIKELVKQNRTKKKSVYVGLDLVYDVVFQFNSYTVDVWLGNGVYMPVGVQWKAPKGFSYSAEIAYLGLSEIESTVPTGYDPRSIHTIFFGLRMGYYF